MEINIILLLTCLAVFIAYFVKGFSGFGPAMILIPSLTLLYDAETAISASTYFDIIAGIILFISVRKSIDWKFVIPITLLLFIGAYFGAHLLKSIPTQLLEKNIGYGLILFSGILIFQKQNDDEPVIQSKIKRIISLPIALIAGFSGGMIGISGPFLVLFMKLNYKKTYFRTQLIGIFAFGAIWRFSLYRIHNIAFEMDIILIIILTAILLFGLWFGQHLHFKVNEKNFTRIIALILLIPAVNLLLQ
ncbi:MAG: sulfite exporter TauE/SafE family protein [Calditrichaceae bacterium]|nr:sulfite exporter TauE/SafE family protein [Calditrichaceae bacterium]